MDSSMNPVLSATPLAAPSGVRSITDPRVDRAVATVASLPFAYMLYYRLAYEGFDLPRIAIALNFALLIATMVVRRPPVRVTPKPLYWATAFLATYWGFMTRRRRRRTRSRSRASWSPFSLA
jgi:hypothetical protein